MNLEEIGLHCDRLKERLTTGERISVDQYVEVHDLPRDPQLLSELRQVHQTHFLPSTVGGGHNTWEPRRIGNYEVLELLGQGGMGTVFRARHVRLDKEVALKLIRPRESSNHVAEARFERELRAVGRLEHPNIVRALDAGDFNGVTFLSMELLCGVNLEEATSEGATLAEADACEVIRQAAVGLKHAHDKGMIHRDIKPSNMMLTKDPFGGTCVKVTDFGLALVKGDNADGERLTDQGVAVGTFRYMSLEQARDTRSIDHRADIYSLAATFYRLLVGEPPFPLRRYKTQGEIVMAMMSGEVPKIEQRATGLSPVVAGLITRMLATEPRDRPSDLSEVIDILTPLASDNRLDQVFARSMKTHQRQDSVRATQDVHDFVSKLAASTRSGADDSSSVEQSAGIDDLGILRQRVRRFWVDGVLRRTKGNTHMFALDREVLADCVISPWEGIAESPLHSIDAHSPINELFDYAERSLLILGDAGSGKSTALLELTESLLQRSESSRREASPVLLHLSSWNRNARSFDQWIIQELSAKYKVPKHIGREFVGGGRLIPLLDGMDEVRPADQRACIESLNEFMTRTTPPGVAVCSRDADYVAAGIKLHMSGAIRLKPLTPQQIMASVSGSTSARRPLMHALEKHQALLELASSPLILSMMKNSFDQTGADSSDRFSTIRSAREHVFDTYVKESFRTKQRTSSKYGKAETLSWLSWIARQMRARNQTVFMMDELQPDWFVTRRQRWLYLLALSLILGTISGLATMYFWYCLMPIMDTSSSMSSSSLLWLMLQLPVWWTLVCLLDVFVLPRHTARSFVGRLFTGFGKSLLYLILWMVWPLVGYLTGFWAVGWTVANVLLGIVTSASVGILGRRKRVTVDVDVAQPLGISLAGSFRGWLTGCTVGFVVYLTYQILWAYYLLDEPPDWFPYLWTIPEERRVAVAWPLAFGSVGLVAGGLVARMRLGQTAPNQGLRIYFRNMLIAAAFSLVSVYPTGLFVLTFWLELPGNPSEFTWLERAKIISGEVLWASFYLALCFGALDLIVHGLTRLILSLDRTIPNRLPEFLKHASRLGLLRRAGGAHIFGHRMLLEYFADKKNWKSVD